MKAAKLVVMIAASVFAACSNQQGSTSSVKGENDTPVAADDATSLPGTPQAVGFRIVDSSSTTMNVLVRIAPGAPRLQLKVWSSDDTSNVYTFDLTRQDPCTSNDNGWSCSYMSDDGQEGLTVRYYAAAPDTFAITNVTKDGQPVQNILPPPNPPANSDSGCDPDNPLMCGWF